MNFVAAVGFAALAAGLMSANRRGRFGLDLAILAGAIAALVTLKMSQLSFVTIFWTSAAALLVWVAAPPARKNPTTLAAGCAGLLAAGFGTGFSTGFALPFPVVPAIASFVVTVGILTVGLGLGGVAGGALAMLGFALALDFSALPIWVAAVLLLNPLAATVAECQQYRWAPFLFVPLLVLLSSEVVL